MENQLKLTAYREQILLDQTVTIESHEDWQSMLKPVLSELGITVQKDTSVDQLIFTMHGRLAEIEPFTLPDDLVGKIEIIASGINNTFAIPDGIALPTIAEAYQVEYSAKQQTAIWVGDITKLKVDAIVNAANSYLLGCRLANHACIDNAIHSAAGPRLRDDCQILIQNQRQLEPVGTAKITRGYALPANYVLHTVGPQLRHGTQPTGEQKNQLQSSYLSCLDLASKVASIKTIALCATSTGVFGYPKEAAASVALKTVAEWLTSNPGRFDRIIFNLYSSHDASVYENVLYDL